MIERKSVAELSADPLFRQLLREYAAESAIAGIDPGEPRIDIYEMLESAGAITVLASYDNGELSGFLCLLVSILPHFGVKVATTESYFVTKEKRHTGAGLALLREAETLAKELGASCILVSAPIGGRLDKILESVDTYRETNRVFFRRLADV
jgi:GNAT superfamily N-acetyltransferase